MTDLPSHYTPRGDGRHSVKSRAAAGGRWPGLLPRCGLGLRLAAGVACESGCGLPVTSAQFGMRTRFQAWRWGLDLRVAPCCTEACMKRLERGEVYVRRKVKTKVPCSSDVR